LQHSEKCLHSLLDFLSYTTFYLLHILNIKMWSLALLFHILSHRRVVIQTDYLWLLSVPTSKCKDGYLEVAITISKSSSYILSFNDYKGY